MKNFLFYLGKRREIFLFLFLIVSGLILRLWNLGKYDLWYDEVYSFFVSRYFFNAAGSEFPLSFLLLNQYFGIIHIVGNIFQANEFFLRLPSVLFDILNIFILYKLGRAFFSARIAFYAALLMAFSPFHLWYAQEVRFYSLLSFWATFSSYYFLKVLRVSDTKSWFIFIIISMAGLHAGIYYLLIFVPQLIFLFVTVHRQLAAKYFWIATGCAFLYIVWRCLFLQKLLSASSFLSVIFNYGVSWIPKPTFLSIKATIENLLFGYNGTTVYYSIGSLVTLPAFFYFFSALRKTRGNEKLGYLSCFLLFFLPMVAIFIFSVYFFSLYLDRVFILLSHFLYLIVAIGVSHVTVKPLRRIWILTIFCLQLAGVVFYFANTMPTEEREHHVGVHRKGHYKAVVSFLNANLEEGDIILFNGTSAIPSLVFYGLKGQEKIKLLCLRGSRQKDPMWKALVDSNRHIFLDEVSSLKFRYLWVIFSDWNSQKVVQDSPEAIHVKSFLDGHFILDIEKKFDGLFIFRYKTQ